MGITEQILLYFALAALAGSAVLYGVKYLEKRTGLTIMERRKTHDTAPEPKPAWLNLFADPSRYDKGNGDNEASDSQDNDVAR